MTSSDQATALTPRQEALIAALLSSPSITEAATVAGVGDKTARRWLKLPHFQEAYQAAKEEVFSEALASLKLIVNEAVETLKNNLSGVEVPPAVQVRAAQIVLEQAITIHKTQTVERNLALLEQLMKAQALGK